jgi:hypothetical protein
MLVGALANVALGASHDSIAVFPDLFEPATFVAVRLTWYIPTVLKVCCPVWNVLFAVPSPHCHNQLVGTPVEVSVNNTVHGLCPFVLFTVNEATGTGVFAVIMFVVFVQL